MSSVSSGRTRLGITLWVLSYVPIPIAMAAILHIFGILDGKGDTTRFIAVAWAIQIVIGFIGLALAGSTAISLIRKRGIKKLPVNFWRVLKGDTLEAASIDAM